MPDEEDPEDEDPHDDEDFCVHVSCDSSCPPHAFCCPHPPDGFDDEDPPYPLFFPEGPNEVSGIGAGEGTGKGDGLGEGLGDDFGTGTGLLIEGENGATGGAGLFDHPDVGGGEDHPDDEDPYPPEDVPHPLDPEDPHEFDGGAPHEDPDPPHEFPDFTDEKAPYPFKQAERSPPHPPDPPNPPNP